MDFLYELFSFYDTIIVNGDLWSVYSCVLDDFLNSPWVELLNLLKERKSYFIFGNHDREEWCDKRFLDYFKASSNELTFNVYGNVYHVQHGHLLKTDSIHNELFMKLHRGSQFWKLDKFIQGKLISYFTDSLYDFGGKRMNKFFKKKLNTMKRKGVNVIGHSHSVEYDHIHNFVNSGFISYGYANFLIVDEAGIYVMRETY